jgi:hypothetical protein
MATVELEDVQGDGWSRTTWLETADDGSIVVVRQVLRGAGDQEVVWRVPTDRVAELGALLHELVDGADDGAPVDAASVVVWAEDDVDRVDLLVEALERMDPAVVDDIVLG